MVYMGVYPKPFLERDATTVVKAIQKRVMHQAGGTVEHTERLRTQLAER